jgi:hypothetical protein
MAIDIHFGSAPRTGSDAAQPGSYVPAIRLAQSRVDPGAIVKGEIFITGYGQIGFAKLVFYPSLGLIEPDTSVANFGLGIRNGQIFFGDQEKKFGSDGYTIALTGAHNHLSGLPPVCS